MKGSEKVADKWCGDKGDPVGPEPNSETSLPHSDAIAPIPSNEDQPINAQGTLKGGRRILIVDDETNIADTLALIFKMRRYEVRVAYSAESAIEVIAQWRPDLAVLDVILPGMNGIELAIAVKANYPACRMMLFSGHAKTGTLLEEAAMKGHQFEVMAKPVYPDVMLERASELLTMPDEPAYD
jgi:DNA-binding NtrC family response regulator